MSRAITAPMTEPIRPLVLSSRMCPKIRLARRPPMNDPTMPGEEQLRRVSAVERRDSESGIEREVLGDRGRVGPRGCRGHEVRALDQLHIAPWLALPGESALGIAVRKNVADRLDLRIQLERGPGGPALFIAVENGGLLELVHPFGERVDVGHHLEDRLGRGLYFYG